MTVKVYFSAPGCWSPMSRFTHAFVTLMVNSFAPGFNAEVASTRYGICQTIPSGLPFTVTSARFLTSPKSIQRCAPGLNHSAGAWMVLVYVPTPEKYFTPGSVLSLHEASLSSVVDGGAPRSGWKLTFQAPSIVSSLLSIIVERVRELSLAGLRKTTNTVPQGSR